MTTKKNAVVLLSGGLDSVTALAIAQHQGYQCYALSFRYGQRHTAELVASEKIAKAAHVKKHHIVDLDLSLFESSALINQKLDIPIHPTNDIPITYVPARNTIFLSIAIGWAEVLEADSVYIGVNALDYSGYPDCRPEFIHAFQSMCDLATKAGVGGNGVKIQTPLINMTKAEIIKEGMSLGVDYANTVSCYQATLDGLACGQCESCQLRVQGFVDAGVKDPTHYK
ncbi:MAG: 7-cyano-7-deazaguanine synthase QueC [Gammaproteobacteria bacterium]|nr:7-cyano-7-deazaguanine synthase QueC [Gammaproteobacteria bacterium]